MKVIDDPLEFQSECEAVRGNGKRLGLVPTMGALHEGHLSLVDRARSAADIVALTIFLNPTQFAAGEDLERYPRDLEGDLSRSKARGVDLVFTPDQRAMYHEGDATRVTVTRLTEGLCGVSRPSHFQGVATVVSKLFNLAGRCHAVFGRKDYQQLKVIERMTRDLFFPVEIVSVPTLREHDGLAMSSRNLRLSKEQREAALGLSQGLRRAQRAFDSGERHRSPLCSIVSRSLAMRGLREDYVTLSDADELLPIDVAGDRALLAVAAFAGETRLIDNVVLGEDPPLPL